MNKFPFHRTVIGLLSFVLITLAALFIIPSVRPAQCSQDDPQCEVLKERITKPRNDRERNNRNYYCAAMKDRNCSEYKNLCEDEGSTNKTTSDKSESGGPPGFTFCAKEHSRCEFTGSADVAYGADGKFNYQKDITDGIDCNNEKFGDPIYGTFK